MSRASLTAQEREAHGKGVARSLRREGNIPAILYGKKAEATKLQLKSYDLEMLIQQHGTGGLVDLKVGDRHEVVLIRDVQYDPLKRTIEHADFLAIALDEEISTVVPFVIVGEEDRVSDEGVVASLIREIEIRCLPTNLPESIEVDVSKAVAGDTLTIADIEFPEGVEPVLDPDEAVVSIVIPREEPEEDEDVESDEDVSEEEATEEVASSDAEDA